jgi:hypothetical protein
MWRGAMRMLMVAFFVSVIFVACFFLAFVLYKLAELIGILENMADIQ